jgi:serine/threonine protein kinase/tetratricopeptide (TPR) repeat protein
MSLDIQRYLAEVDDGTVAEEIEHHRRVDVDATVGSREIDASEDRFLDEFAAAHKAGVFGGGSIVEAPQAAGYEIERELSRGAQGAVFLARQTATRRQVALKVLLRGAFASERQLVRFEREVEMVAALNHPGIVTVYDSGTTPDGRAWLAMEFVDGETLDGWLGRRDGLGQAARRRLAVGLIADVCDAVAAAHMKGVIHRDLKPDNILVDADGCPHVLDFGLAKPVDDSEWDSSRIEVTTAGEFMGTFAYAAPEQVSGDPDRIDVRTDVFTLGVILYEAVLGCRPFVLEGSIADVVRTIAEATPTPPRSVDATLDRDVETILMRALDRDPDRRYQGPADLARDLRHWLRGEPIEAMRDDAWYVARKFLRRHWLPVGLSGGAVALLIAFGITMFVAWGREAAANQRLRGTVGMVSSVLGAADAENIDQAMAAASMDEMLQRWLKVVDHDLVEYPEIAAAVRLDLAENHIGNARWDDAAAAIDAAAAGLHLDAAHPSATAGRLLHLRGRLRYKEADYDRAVEDYAAALAHRRATAPSSEETAVTMHHLAASLRRAGRSDEAATQFDEALSRHRTLVREARGEVDARRRRIELSNVLNSVAVGHVVDRPEAALPHLREAVTLVELDSEDPSRDWRVAALRHNIGDCLARLGRLDEAEASLAEALRVKTLQRSRTSMGNTEAALARLALARGDTAAASGHLSRAEQLRSGRLPEGHPSYRDERLIAIELDLRTGELMAAEAGIAAERSRGGLPPRVDAALLRLEGVLALERGAFDAAEPLLQAAMEAFTVHAGERSPQVRKCASSLERVHLARGDHAVAAQFHDRSKPPSEVSGDGGGR